MAERTTRGWQAENVTVVVDAATVTDANAEARSEVEESVPARPPQPNPIAAPVVTAPLGASSSATVLDADRPLAPHMVPLLSRTTPLERVSLASHPFISRIYTPCPTLVRNDPTSQPQTLPPARP